jgi:hypothetical protein
LSRNARSEILFFQFSQTLAQGDGKNNFKSDFWLSSFDFQISHFAQMKENGAFELWNRLYVDHLFITCFMKFTSLEWSTFRAWTFDFKVKELVENLNIEMLSNSSSHLRRLYHLVLPADFYNDNFTDTEDDSNWDLIAAEATNFEQHTSRLQSVSWLGTSTDGADGAGTSQAAASTSTTTPVVLQVDVDDFADSATQTAAVDTTSLVDEVFTSEGGNKFHFIDSCKGLAKRTHPLMVKSLEEAKLEGRSLCKQCSDLTHLRAVVCCTVGCTYCNTWHPHFCCKRCKDNLTGEHGRLCSRVTYHPVV